MSGRQTARSRLVARDINTYSAPGLLAVAPPIGSWKYLLRLAARDSMSTSHMYDFTQARHETYT